MFVINSVTYSSYTHTGVVYGAQTTLQLLSIKAFKVRKSDRRFSPNPNASIWAAINQLARAQVPPRGRPKRGLEKLGGKRPQAWLVTHLSELCISSVCIVGEKAVCEDKCTS